MNRVAAVAGALAYAVVLGLVIWGLEAALNGNGQFGIPSVAVAAGLAFYIGASQGAEREALDR